MFALILIYVCRFISYFSLACSRGPCSLSFSLFACVDVLGLSLPGLHSRLDSLFLFRGSIQFPVSHVGDVWPPLKPNFPLGPIDV